MTLLLMTQTHPTMFLQAPKITAATTVLNHLQNLYVFLIATLNIEMVVIHESNHPVAEAVDDREPTSSLNTYHELEQPDSTTYRHQRHRPLPNRKLTTPRLTSIKLKKNISSQWETQCKSFII